MRKLYVANFPFSSSEDNLREAFSQYSPNEVKIMLDRETRKSRGFGFVTVPDEVADHCIKNMHGYVMNGRKLIVREANNQ